MNVKEVAFFALGFRVVHCTRSYILTRAKVREKSQPWLSILRGPATLVALTVSPAEGQTGAEPSKSRIFMSDDSFERPT